MEIILYVGLSVPHPFLSHLRPSGLNGVHLSEMTGKNLKTTWRIKGPRGRWKKSTMSLCPGDIV